MRSRHRRKRGRCTDCRGTGDSLPFAASYATSSSTLRQLLLPGNPRWPAMILIGLAGAVACTPTVRVATEDPITINLNVNIQHEIRVKVDRELEDLFSDDSDLF